MLRDEFQMFKSQKGQHICQNVITFSNRGQQLPAERKEVWDQIAKFHWLRSGGSFLPRRRGFKKLMDGGKNPQAVPVQPFYNLDLL